MNEIQKTLTFVGAALIVALAAYFVQPSRSFQRIEPEIGRNLVPSFNPLSATSMEIMKYDTQNSRVDRFKVEQVEVHGKPRWSIPSHDNYPADAKDQVARAAASLMNLKILGVVSEAVDDQETFGVVDPEKMTTGAKGIGTRVTLADKSGKILISLIIGNKVKEQPEQLRDQSEQHYVRLTGKPAIYTVAVKTDSLVTDFDHWIEKNLLSISPWDIHRLWLRDYSTALLMDEEGQLGLGQHQRGEMVLDYQDQGDPPWKLVEDRVVNKDGTFSPAKMAADEELNLAKLNELKSALGDLKIVDVEPKPKGLSADLKAAADFTNSEEAFETLRERGFVIAKSGDKVEVYSKEGEVRCLMKDGVEYVLRFGDIALGSAAEKKEKDKTGQKPEEKNTSGLNRYLFVMAVFNPEAIEKPKLESLPQVPPAAPAKTEEKTPTPPPAGEKEKAGEKAADSAGTKSAEKTAVENAPAKAEGKTEGKTEGKAEEKAVEKKEGASATAEKTPAAKTPAVDLKALQAETERIKKENQRKEDEYNQKIEAGKKHVEELNHRFADWYYIISDAEYRKIHLSRGDVVKKKEKKEEKKEAAKDAVKTPEEKSKTTPPKNPQPNNQSVNHRATESTEKKTINNK
jgi:hypothetical protein